jgi:hypothetical protein
MGAFGALIYAIPLIPNDPLIPFFLAASQAR